MQKPLFVLRRQRAPLWHEDEPYMSTNYKKVNDAPRSGRAVSDPNRLPDAFIEKRALKNDAVLRRALAVKPPVVSEIRRGTLLIGPTMLIRMHEVGNLNIHELRDLMTKKNLLG